MWQLEVCLSSLYISYMTYNNRDCLGGKPYISEFLPWRSGGFSEFIPPHESGSEPALIVKQIWIRIQLNDQHKWAFAYFFFFLLPSLLSWLGQKSCENDYFFPLGSRLLLRLWVSVVNCSFCRILRRAVILASSGLWTLRLGPEEQFGKTKENKNTREKILSKVKRHKKGEERYEMSKMKEESFFFIA